MLNVGSMICSPTVVWTALRRIGVLAMDDQLLVIFDDSTAIAILDQDLSRTAANRLIYPDPKLAADPYAGTGYEDIARDPISGHLYLLVEAVKREGALMPRVEILDAGIPPPLPSIPRLRAPGGQQGHGGAQLPQPKG